VKPTWWLRYIIGLSLVGLLGLVEISGPRGGLQSVLEIIVVIGAGCRSWARTAASSACSPRAI
jgi:hypothetical protein